MAVTISLYNHSAKLLADGSVTLASLKVMLLDVNAVFTAADVDIYDVAGSAAIYEVAGNGWTVGGETLASVAVTTVTTNDAKLDASDVSVVASGGSIGPAYAAVIYDSVSDKPLAYIDFGGAITAEEGVNFLLSWNASGIFTWTYT